MSKKILVGKVVSTKMKKTVVVAVDMVVTHPVYKKALKRTRRFMAHDDIGVSLGDVVRIEESRPISKHKRWVVLGKVDSKGGKAK